MNKVNLLFLIPIYLVFLKAIIIGNDFNFHLWIKYKKEYISWYNNRPKFKGKK